MVSIDLFLILLTTTNKLFFRFLIKSNVSGELIDIYWQKP